MTLAEFKAWLDGYSASFTDGAPNAEQWAVISEKLAGVVPFALGQSAAVNPSYFRTSGWTYPDPVTCTN